MTKFSSRKIKKNLFINHLELIMKELIFFILVTIQTFRLQIALMI